MIFDKAKFFKECRRTVMGPTLDGDEVTGAEAITDAMQGLPLAYVAYALATSYHETGHTMQPIKEYGGNAYFHRMYDKEGRRPHVARALGNTKPGDGVRYAGRGYVQLTGRANYTKAHAQTGFPLTRNPDLAMRRDVAAQIMREGMLEGWFTGKKFASYLPSDRPATIEQFTSARRIINGRDKARMIAKYAVEFQSALIAGGWK